MDRQLNYDRTTTTISDISPFKFALSDADIKNFEKCGELMKQIAQIGGEAMARRIGNSYPGNSGVSTDEACRMINGVPSEQTNEHLVVGRQSTKSIKTFNRTFKDFLFDMIKATVRQEEHLGDNLKRQCLEYLDELKNREMEEKQE